MNAKLILFPLIAVLLTACSTATKPLDESETKIDQAEEVVFSVHEGKIYNEDGKDLARDKMPFACEVGTVENAFEHLQSFDEGRYLAAQLLYCPCNSFCNAENLYVFDTQNENHITNEEIYQELLQAEPELGEMNQSCYEGSSNPEPECLYYQVKEIQSNTLTLNLFQNDSELTGEYAYPCTLSTFIDMEYSFADVQSKCGYKLVKEVEITSFAELF